jgi:fructose-1,6-bisphosphatase II
MLGRVAPQSAEEKQACLEAGVDLKRILTCTDMVGGEEVFFSATGVTDGVLLKGVSYHGNTVETNSLVLRYETGTRRIINTEHTLR